ncbi:uncharacterized protein LOC122011422 isoform X2 [Zingiber officinale]|uniref:uncharacterized protein LOC122011422 isoform X2 n=1 Tax=Zingiber officinale TaxID=94328 RepID=UPI001C4CA53C|nr:uncharacterized protein LOC122011422 isoform X2 [Zingiber officinale]
MAKAFEDSDVWLPDGISGDKGGVDWKFGRKDCFPIEFPFEFAANLDSPVESATETEASDEDGEDYVAGLTKQMARYFLQDEDVDEAVAADTSEAMTGSPQSTLCAPSASSNKRSPNGPSLASSPIEQRGKGKDPGVPLHEAAGQVQMRRRINEFGHRESILDCGNPNKTSPVPTSPKKAAASYFSPNPAFTPQQLQAAHVNISLPRSMETNRQAKMQQVSAARAKQSKAKSGGGAYGENTRYCRPLDLPASAWPPSRKSPPAQAQQRKPPPSSLPGRGMRTVFLHAAGSKKESTGTGVFLPRTVGNKLAPKKKTGCSTILVPDRVIQALNLNREDFATQPRFPGGFVLSHDVLIGRSNAHRKPHHMAQEATPVPLQLAAAAAAAAAVPESRLPREWTY